MRLGMVMKYALCSKGAMHTHILVAAMHCIIQCDIIVYDIALYDTMHLSVILVRPCFFSIFYSRGRVGGLGGVVNWESQRLFGPFGHLGGAQRGGESRPHGVSASPLL